MGKRFNKPSHKNNTDKGIGANKIILETIDSTVKFSFKYLSFQNSKFQVENRNSNYFLALINRLQSLSTLDVDYLTSNTKNKSLRSHPIDWDDERVTENCFGIPYEEQIVKQPWQFELTVNEHGRVHGFFIDNIFNIVWFDPDHKLYKSSKNK